MARPRQGGESKVKTTGGGEEEEEEDVMVRLLHPNTNSYLLALPLHSHVLVSRSDFFAARFSQRWDPKLSGPSTHFNSSNSDIKACHKCEDFSDKHDASLHKEPVEHKGLHFIDITMSNSSATTTYKKCLQLMYVPRKYMYSCRPFSSVEDAISMLYVAAELLFRDCIDHCMQYLEMLPVWTEEEESSIRSTLSSLQLTHINDDLAARLSLSQSIPPQEPMHTMRRMLLRVLQITCERLPILQPALKSIDISKPIPEATVLLVWNANLDIIKARLKQKVHKSMCAESTRKDVESASSSLSWLLAKLVPLEAADAVVRAFVEDTELSNLIEDLLKRHTSLYNDWAYIAPVLSLLNQVIPLVFGEVLLSRSARMTLINTWLPVVRGLTHSNYACVANVVDGIPKLISSLPVLDREHIYNKFMKLCDRSVLSVDSSFGPWCEMLRQLHLEHGEGQEGLLAIKGV